MKQESADQYSHKKRTIETHIPTDHDLEYRHPHHIDHIRSDGIQTAEPESWEEGDDYRRYHALVIEGFVKDIDLIVV
jgi:hypothetical protein